MTDEPPVYHPITEHPWPDSEGWIAAWWSDDYGQWCAGQIRQTKQEVLDFINGRANDDMVWRVVKEIRTYTTEDD